MDALKRLNDDISTGTTVVPHERQSEDMVIPKTDLAQRIQNHCAYMKPLILHVVATENGFVHAQNVALLGANDIPLSNREELEKNWMQGLVSWINPIEKGVRFCVINFIKMVSEGTTFQPLVVIGEFGQMYVLTPDRTVQDKSLQITVTQVGGVEDSRAKIATLFNEIISDFSSSSDFTQFCQIGVSVRDQLSFSQESREGGMSELRSKVRLYSGVLLNILENAEKEAEQLLIIDNSEEEEDVLIDRDALKKYPLRRVMESMESSQSLFVQYDYVGDGKLYVLNNGQREETLQGRYDIRSFEELCHMEKGTFGKFIGKIQEHGQTSCLLY